MKVLYVAACAFSELYALYEFGLGKSLIETLHYSLGCVLSTTYPQ